MDDEATLATRLASVEERLDRLEHAPTPAIEATASHDRLVADDVLWALNPLKQRIKGTGGVVYAGNPTVAAGPVEWQIGMTTEQLMESDWSTFAPSIAALGHPVRLELMHAILGGVTGTTELSAGEGMGTTGQLYHHLGQLVAQGWLISRGRGQYGIPPERVVPLMIILTAARRIV